MIDGRFYKNHGPLSLETLLSLSGALLGHALGHGTPDGIFIHDVASLEEAGPQALTFYHNPKYRSALETTKAGFCFMSSSALAYAPSHLVPLLTSNPHKSYALIAHRFYPGIEDDFSTSDQQIHPTASIGPDCIIEPGVIIHAHAVIGKGCRLGAQTVIGRGVSLGEKCLIGSGASITHTLIGNRVRIQPGACIGQAGFGVALDPQGNHVSVPQLGRVLIEDDVEIGANTTIDRGHLGDTVIGQGSRLDNLIMIAHNVRIGKGCIVVAQVGIAGSTSIGDGTVIGGQVGISGHLRIGSRVQIAAKSGVMKDIPDGTTVGGNPAIPMAQCLRRTIALDKLAQLYLQKEKTRA